ncbi:hypothetical protein EON79_19620 [bacterium]|nr:MAG: hypothetical protein EON79_19620 [bacterium]
MIGGELGGVDRALRSLEAAQAGILASLTPDERKLLAEVDPRTKESGPGGAITPRYLERTTEEFPEPTPDLLTRFQKAVSRLPGYPAVLLRGGMVGAVLSPIFAAHPQGWLISLGSFGLGVALFSWAWFLHRNKVERMRLELLQRLEDSLGRQAYKRGHDLLGVSREGGEDGPIRLGVLPQLWRYLEDWEKPLVRGFEGVQSSGVALMRRVDEWPDGFLLGVDWLDVEDPWLLHGDTKYKPEDATATARELLREEKIFAAWRCPSFPTIEGAVASTGRRDQLVDFEEKRIGDFFQELSRLYDRHEADRHHAERVVKRLELLALRCLPLARSVAEKDVVASDRTLRISVPESLDWLDNAKRVQGSSGASPDGIPSASGFQRRISWLFADQATQVDEREADHATALGLFPAPDAATAAEWLGVPAEAVAQ